MTIWRGAALVVIALLFVLVALWAFQRRLIYFPSQDVGPLPPAAEPVSFATDDGLDLEAWWVPAEGQSQGTVIVFPGNAGNRADRLPLATELAALGYETLLVDYRGYGGNPGSPSEDGLARDARAALAYLTSREDVDPTRIAYFGESLGSGVAVQLAVEEPPSALILRSPFTSLADVGARQFPVLPVSLLLKDRFDNAAKIAPVGVPLLIVAGEDDGIVPMSLSRELYEHADEPKELVVIKAAGHNDFALLAGEEMIEAIERFLSNGIE